MSSYRIFYIYYCSNKDINIKNMNCKDDLKLFYNYIFSSLVDEKLSYSNRTHNLKQTTKEMITCLETNISTHVIYINCLFKDPKSQH